MTEWRDYPDECRDCGDDLEVLTESEQEGFVFDNDLIRCVACGATGIIDVRDDDDVLIQWHETEAADALKEAGE